MSALEYLSVLEKGPPESATDVHHGKERNRWRILGGGLVVKGHNSTKSARIQGDVQEPLVSSGSYIYMPSKGFLSQVLGAASKR